MKMTKEISVKVHVKMTKEHQKQICFFVFFFIVKPSQIRSKKNSFLFALSKKESGLNPLKQGPLEAYMKWTHNPFLEYQRTLRKKQSKAQRLFFIFFFVKKSRDTSQMSNHINKPRAGTPPEHLPQRWALWIESEHSNYDSQVEHQLSLL